MSRCLRCSWRRAKLCWPADIAAGRAANFDILAEEVDGPSRRMSDDISWFTSLDIGDDRAECIGAVANDWLSAFGGAAQRRFTGDRVPSTGRTFCAGASGNV